ncbi:MAG: hypothetical protein HQL38_12020 [Alphaproteobacteria bacterium]|nr:hypothetical protein [Alphaproteobacteria bacterium]MBF0393396.1 hypothetical protein [Alphaproteobacteria bacterium]
MAGRAFSFPHFATRWLVCQFLVLMTYNPSGYSYAHWMWEGRGYFFVDALAGVALLGAYLFLFHAVLMSIGLLGMLAGVVASGLTVAEVLRLGHQTMDARGLIETTLLVSLATLLAVGLSWGHIVVRLTGQKQKRYFNK